MDGIRHVVRTGCAWRHLPADLPPWQTVYWYFKQWERDKASIECFLHFESNYGCSRARAPQPSAGHHRLAKRQGRRHSRPRQPRLRRGQEDQWPETVHRHRHAGRAHRGDRARGQRPGPRRSQTTLLHMYLASPIRFVFADCGFAGKLVEWAAIIVRTTLHIMRKPEGQQGFAVVPRRGCVERTLAWLTAHRRLARDYERDSATSEAVIRWAAINTMTNRITRTNQPSASNAGRGPTRAEAQLRRWRRLSGASPARDARPDSGGAAGHRPDRTRRG